MVLIISIFPFSDSIQGVQSHGASEIIKQFCVLNYSSVLQHVVEIVTLVPLKLFC